MWQEISRSCNVKSPGTRSAGDASAVVALALKFEFWNDLRFLGLSGHDAIKCEWLPQWKQPLSSNFPCSFGLSFGLKVGKGSEERREEEEWWGRCM